MYLRIRLFKYLNSYEPWYISHLINASLSSCTTCPVQINCYEYVECGVTNLIPRLYIFNAKVT